MSKKNKGSPKTADIYLSAPLLQFFLFDLDLSSVLKLFICPNMDFLSLFLLFTCSFAFKSLEDKKRYYIKTIFLRYWDWDGTKNLKTSYNQMDLVALEKIESCILNGSRYIGRLEKKSGNSPTILGGKCEAFFISAISEEVQLQANPED